MKTLTRIFICLVGALFLGYVGFFVVATLGPLLFPEPIAGSSTGVNIVIFSLPIFFIICGVAGFWICWKLTRRFSGKA